jgi:hypothetical protein
MECGFEVDSHGYIVETSPTPEIKLRTLNCSTLSTDLERKEKNRLSAKKSRIQKQQMIRQLEVSLLASKNYIENLEQYIASTM